MNPSRPAPEHIPFDRRPPPGMRTLSRLAERRRRHDLPTRINRARLVYLLTRSGSPLTDWVPLGMACAVVGLMFIGA